MYGYGCGGVGSYDVWFSRLGCDSRLSLTLSVRLDLVLDVTGSVVVAVNVRDRLGCSVRGRINMCV